MNRREEIRYVGPPPVFPKCPDTIKGESATAWNSLIANGGLMNIERFDDDWAPIGPKLRKLFIEHGAYQSSSDTTTIIFLPEVR